MSKSRKSNGFTNQYSKVLSLSESQIKKMDNAEYLFMKDYHWNRLPKDCDPEEIFKERLYSFLSADQLVKLKLHEERKKSDLEEKKKEKLLKSLAFQRERLADLNLSEDQLKKYVEVKSNWSGWIREFRTSKDFDKSWSVEEISEFFKSSRLYPIFDEVQIVKYEEILSKQKSEGLKWKMNQRKLEFKSRFEIDLTEEQAEKIFKIESNIPAKDEYGKYYSDFEKLDKELVLYKQILEPEQFEKYKPHHDGLFGNIVDSLVKSNNKHHSIQLDRVKNYIVYYVKNVLPHLSVVRSEMEQSLNDYQRKLIKEIRAYYFSKLEERKADFVVQHERYNRNYCPNELEVFMKRQELAKVNCNISLLYNCQASKDLMTIAMQEQLKKVRNKLEGVYNKLNEFQIEYYEKSGGTYGIGWHFNVPLKEGEEHLRYINLILLYPKLESNLKLLEI